MTHVLIWTAFGLFFYRQFFFSDNVPFDYWLKQTVTLGLLVTAFYLNSLVLVPKFLLNNHTAVYILVVLTLLLTITFINRWVDDGRIPYLPGILASVQRNQAPGTAPIGRRPPRLQTGLPIKLGDIFTIIMTILVLGISTTITAIAKWQKDNQERKELERDKITTELSLLRAQINPHFFFNTLNNIYALTELNPKLAGEAIHKLSKMMRYILYDTRKTNNLLSEEILFVKTYIGLMSLRLTDRAKITIDIPSSLQDLPLAPMIFLPFIENAFKHGVSATHDSYINIAISQNEKVIALQVKNSIRNDNNISLDTASGIGLTNTRRRLDLLYPGKYKLGISGEDVNNEFIVHLELDLS